MKYIILPLLKAALFIVLVILFIAIDIIISIAVSVWEFKIYNSFSKRHIIDEREFNISPYYKKLPNNSELFKTKYHYLIGRAVGITTTTT